MAKTGSSAHPDDETLSDLLDDGVSSNAKLQQHVNGCDICSARLDELRDLRRLLHKVGAQAATPPKNLTHNVIKRLRMRRGAVGSLNEVLAAIRLLIEGLSSLFGGRPPEDGVPDSGKGLPHG